MADAERLSRSRLHPDFSELYRNSTSAGATIRAAAGSPDHVGSSQIVASQPG